MNMHDPDYRRDTREEVAYAKWQEIEWMFDTELQELMNDARWEAQQAAWARLKEKLIPSGPHTVIIDANYDLDREPSPWLAREELERIRAGDIGGGMEDEEC